MPQTMPQPQMSTPRNSLDDVCLKPAKAALKVNASQRRLTAVVKEALIAHFGTLKCAAISMREMDEGQLSRELESGKFKFERLDVLDEDAKGAVSDALYRAFGNRDPKARAQRLIRDIRSKADELSEMLA